jgi:hypothetical protein
LRALIDCIVFTETKEHSPNTGARANNIFNTLILHTYRYSVQISNNFTHMHTPDTAEATGTGKQILMH